MSLGKFIISRLYHIRNAGHNQSVNKIFAHLNIYKKVIIHSRLSKVV